MNPVFTLQQPFKVPGGSSRVSGSTLNNNAPGRGFGGDKPISGRTGAPFVLQTQDSNLIVGSSSSSPWSDAAARAVKRAKNNAGGLVYRDGESTGYEDDGSEAPMVDDWVAIHKGPFQSTASHNHSNGNGLHHGSKNAPAVASFSGLKPRSSDAGSSAAVSCTRYFQCQWRKPQQKKHKTWEGDGILKVTGGKAALHDQESSAIIATGRLPREPDLLIDEVFTLSGKEIMIELEIPSKDFLAGKVFGNKPVSQQAQPVRPSATLPATASTSSFYGKPATATTSSFYGSSTASKAIIKKFTAPTVTRTIPSTHNASTASAYAPTHVGLPPVQNFYSKGKKKEDLSDFEGPDTRLQAGLDSFPTFRSNSINFRPTAKSTNGLGAPPKEPKPLFNPNAPNALVMKRLPPDMEKHLNRKDLPVVDVVIDPLLALRMRDHQKEGIKFLYESVMGMRSEGHGCILADEMGLGKTIQAIALVHTLLKQTPFFGGQPIIQQAVIVCPVTLVKNWKKEFIKWLGKDRIRVFTAESKQSVKNFVQGARHWHVLIIGYERLRTVVSELSKASIGLMICDEGHRLKSAGAKTTKALRELNVEKRVILSGTPIQNELSEFHSMVDFVNPGILDSYSSFKKIFEFPIMKSRQPGCSANDKELGQYRAESLNEATSPFILRRTSEVIQGFLPPKSEYVVFIAPTPIQKQLYAHVIASEAVKDFVAKGGKAALVLIDLLKKICNSPMLLTRQEEMEKANAEIVRSALTLMPGNARSMGPALSGKMKALQSMLRTLRDGTDEKIVIVSNFVQTLNLIQSLCEREHYGWCRLDGSTKPEDRQHLVDKFNKTGQESNFVFLLSTKAGGTGLNIVGASRLVLFDSDWNPANDLQAMGRIHRDGQKKECFIYRFVTTGTIDEKIFQRQITKIGLADSVMQEGSSKSGKDSDAFTTQQLRSLFKQCDDTPCETHDQLECGCKTGARYVLDEDADAEETEVATEKAAVVPTRYDSDSEDDLPELPVFVKASQYKIPKSKVDTDLKQNLAVLKEWLHVNCQTNDERKADNVQDDVLRDMVLRSMEAMRIPTARGGNLGDDSSDDEESGITPLLPVLKPQYQGGEVTFVFHKKKGALDSSTTHSPDPLEV